MIVAVTRPDDLGLMLAAVGGAGAAAATSLSLVRTIGITKRLLGSTSFVI